MIFAAGDAPLQLLHPLRYWGYEWWSGAGSDLGELTLVAAVAGLYKHKNCEEPHCWRLGHNHPDHGRPVCRKHYLTHKPPLKENT